MPVAMEIIGGGREKSTIYIAVLTLAILGIGLVVSTWQVLKRQKEADMEHLELTAAAVLQAVDSSLRRGPMAGWMGGNRTTPETREFFRELERSGDILFVGIVDEQGNRVAADSEPRPPLVLPEDAPQTLKTANRWQGPAIYDGTHIYVAARRIQGMPGGPPVQGNDPGNGPRHGQARRHHREQPPAFRAGPSLFLIVAVDMEKHFAAYKSFRNTALFQTAYTLAAAVSLWILAVRFISRRKLAGKAVLLEQFQARLIDNLPDGMLITDADGHILAANPAACGIFGRDGASRAQIVGQDIGAVTRTAAPPVDPDFSNGWQQAVLDGLQLEIMVLPYRTEQNTGEGGPSRMIIVRDRTRIRTLEKDLAEAEKLAAVGSLAAGVAHEIRNPLSALRGFAQYFAKKLAGKNPEEEYARTMVRESDRLNRVITDLLYLARPRDLVPVRMDMGAVCDEMTTLLHFELREKRLSLACAFEAGSLHADPDALKQALLNLLLNAVEALNSGETPAHAERAITIRSRHGTESGMAGVWVIVEDTGPGMSEEAMSQACAPFFTTKKKGTGLGLALVQTIMQGHGGLIDIASPIPPGGIGGCAVSLFFPDARDT